jgi:hypothetical protein
MVTAQEMGKKGGQATSPAKSAAARKNAGKPRGKWVTAIAYELDSVEDFLAFGSVLVTGKPPAEAMANHEWACSKLRAEGVGLRDENLFSFVQLAMTSKKV